MDDRPGPDCEGGDRPLRRDAAANRARILAAAAEVFAELGLEAGYEEIARRACVGVGTVYRRFPARDELVEALFEDRMAEMAGLAEEALGAADPWEGLVSFLERSLALQVADRGLKEALLVSGLHSGPLTAARDRLLVPIGALLARAQETGAVRGDVGVGDLGMISSLLGALGTVSEPDLWRRYLRLVLDGMRAERTAPTPLPLAEPSPDQVTEAMHAALRR